MALTADARRLLDRFAEVGVKPYDEMSVLEARTMVLGSTGLQLKPTAEVEVVETLAAAGEGELPARVYRSPDVEPGPLVVYMHGGGWVAGAIEVADRFCRALAAEAGCCVVSLEYRLSPETRFPQTPEDCYAATVALAARAEELGAAPGRLVLCGDSAGGNLAAALSLIARDRGGPEIEGQVILYAPLERPGGERHPSRVENRDGYGLTYGGMEWFWSHYLPSPERGDDPLASPLLAPDLTGLPPAYVLAAEYDPLRDEGVAYAERLTQAGVEVELEVVRGAIHGFLGMDRYFEAEASAVRSRLAARLGVGPRQEVSR